MKKFITMFLVVCFVLSGLTPVAPIKKSEAFLFEAAAALSIITGLNSLKGQTPETTPPEVWLGPSFDARVAQPEVGMPDKEGWRKIIFPYDLMFTVKMGYIAKFWGGKSTDYVQYGGDVVKLKKGEPVWVKMTSALQEILDQAGTPAIKNPVVLAPPTTVQPTPPVVSTQPPVQQPATPTPAPTPPVISTQPSDAADIESLTVSYLTDCNGYKYRGRIVKVYITSGIKVDYWDHKTQSARQANKGETIETGEFTWYR